MELSPDQEIFFQRGPLVLNATIVFTWLVMALLATCSWLITRKLSSQPERRSRWQSLLETVVGYIRDQIREITLQAPERYLPFLGTLYLFIAAANLLALVPGYRPPTGSLSTTAALALCVFGAVPFFGISQLGPAGYFQRYLKPSAFMLPFHIIGELSRTLTLAVRLFGNIMSETMILAILISVAPLVLPVVVQGFTLLIGQIQAYIFVILATVYIASATRAAQEIGEANDGLSGGYHD